MSAGKTLPTLSQLRCIDREALAALKIDVANAVIEMSTALTDYNAFVRSGERFPDPDWERRHRFALGKHQQCLANINNIVKAMHQPTPAHMGQRARYIALHDAVRELIRIDHEVSDDGAAFDAGWEAVVRASAAIQQAWEEPDAFVGGH